MKYAVALSVGVVLLSAASAFAGNFTELQELISNALPGDTLVLTEDYTYEDGDLAIISNDNQLGLSIDKPLTIDGNGKTLSGADKMRVLYIDEVGLDGDAVVLKNLTITGGTNIASGPGIFIGQSNKVDFVDCTITGNGTVVGVHTRDGGPIFIDSKALVSFTNCDITANRGADRAGGIYMRGNVTIENSRITNNVGSSRGGGIYVDPGYQSPERGGDWGGNLVIKNSVITGNKGGRGGAIYINPENTTPNIIENCIIRDNDVSENSVGNGGGMVFYDCVASVISCDISNNQAKRGGGLIVDVLTDVTIDSCKITGNKVIGVRSEDQNIGGGILCHDGSHNDNPMKNTGVIRLKSNTITGNTHSMNIADDVNIHWSVNDDKLIEVDPNWIARYDGSIVSEGGNTIGTLVNPKQFIKGTGDSIAAETYDLPEDHPDLPGGEDPDPDPMGGVGSSGCSTGTALFALIGAAFVAKKRV